MAESPLFEKNTLSPKMIFKFFKGLDLFFIHPKTTPNALWQYVFFLKLTDLHCDLSPVEYG